MLIDDARKSQNPLVQRALRDMVVDDSGCWLWQGSVSTAGHGQFGMDYKVFYVHRVMYEEFVGDASGGHVLHNCDVSNCGNPEHLYLGDNKKNAEDRAKRSRRSKNITQDIADDIRMRFESGESAWFISEDLGVSRQTIYNITSGRCWNNRR